MQFAKYTTKCKYCIVWAAVKSGVFFFLARNRLGGKNTSPSSCKSFDVADKAIIPFSMCDCTVHSIEVAPLSAPTLSALASQCRMALMWPFKHAKVSEVKERAEPHRAQTIGKTISYRRGAWKIYQRSYCNVRHEYTLLGVVTFFFSRDLACVIYVEC